MKGSPAIGTRLLNGLELKHQSRFGLDCLNDHSIAEDLSRLLVERTSRGVEAFNCTRLDQFSRSAHDRTRFRPAAYGLTDRVDALTTNLRIESPIGLSTGVRRRTLSYDQPSESFCPKHRGFGISAPKIRCRLHRMLTQPPVSKSASARPPASSGRVLIPQFPPMKTPPWHRNRSILQPQPEKPAGRPATWLSPHPPRKGGR